MTRDEYGFWHATGKEIVLDDSIANQKFYRKVWKEVTHYEEQDDAGTIHIKEVVNQHGLSVIIASAVTESPQPAVVVCLGGPQIPVPNIYEKNSFYQMLMANGFALIIPLRRGVVGISEEWQAALEEHYGYYDIQDTTEAAAFAVARHPDIIDPDRVNLYGGSYGGYVALLMAGKSNAYRRFNAIIAHCGIYDLTTYPWHNQGIPEETMLTYGHTTDLKKYAAKVTEISPKTYINKWSVPVLLIHHMHDTSSWFGQSVAAYNDALRHGKQANLMIIPGPHTYDIKHNRALFHHIISFFNSN
ncbi:MAG: prolyl oligopeptidase family serine peptidase [Prevotella sp.]|nr:prolyl oligopeptidase family serine peptidase [Prevotella sp.]